jgi:quinol monooxygenase YgiN
LIVVTGHIRVAPEDAAAVRPHARTNLAATRKEKGCLLYAYGEDMLEPGLFRIVERWESWEALDAHGNAEHVATWRKALGEIGVLDREVTAHEAGEERVL